MTPVRLESAASRSRVNYSTTTATALPFLALSLSDVVFFMLTLIKGVEIHILSLHWMMKNIIMASQKH